MFSRRSFIVAVLAAAAAGCAGHRAFAEDRKPLAVGEWEKLGSKDAAPRREERDVIEVNSVHRFTAISFRVEKGDLAVEDIKITFDNDSTFSPDTKLLFKEGERSGKIDLPGDARSIKRIRFLYRTPGKDGATVHVYGKVGQAERKR